MRGGYVGEILHEYQDVRKEVKLGPQISLKTRIYSPNYPLHFNLGFIKIWQKEAFPLPLLSLKQKLDG